MPVAETQAGKSALPWDHPLNLGSVGVTGSSAANAVAASADLIIAAGTRLQDFTTGSWALFANPARRILQLNVAAYDAAKHAAIPLVCDARVGLEALSRGLGEWRAEPPDASLRTEWHESVDAVTAPPGGNTLPSDGQVIGAVQRSTGPDAVLVCAAGGLPGELHKLWRAERPNGYHPRVRLLLHGVRDCGRTRREDGPARPGGGGDGRRRQLPDDELRAGDLGDARGEDHRGGARQPGVRLHHPPAGSHRRGALQQPARRRAPRGAVSCRLRGARTGARRGRGEGGLGRSAGAGDGAGAGRRAVVLHRDRHRPDSRAPKRAATGGTSRCPRCPSGRKCGPRARATRTPSRDSARATDRDDPPWRQSHRVDQRRRPVARRSHLARAVPAGGERDRLRGDREGPPDAHRGACPACGARAAWSRVRLGLALARVARAQRGSREGGAGAAPPPAARDGLHGVHPVRGGEHGAR